jgi:hypothetical protein
MLPSKSAAELSALTPVGLARPEFAEMIQKFPPQVSLPQVSPSRVQIPQPMMPVRRLAVAGAHWLRLRGRLPSR